MDGGSPQPPAGAEGRGEEIARGQLRGGGGGGGGAGVLASYSPAQDGTGHKPQPVDLAPPAQNK